MSILGWLETIIVQNEHEKPINDEELTRAHDQAYNQGKSALADILIAY